MRSVTMLLIGLLALTAANAQEDIYQFDTKNQRESYITLSTELRCPKCQNQNLADSNAGASKIMRDVIAEELLAGKTEHEIKTMMVDRYGEFVLYKPPVKLETLLLWWAPVIFLGLVLLVFILVVKKRSKYATDDE